MHVKYTLIKLCKNVKSACTRLIFLQRQEQSERQVLLPSHQYFLLLLELVLLISMVEISFCFSDDFLSNWFLCQFSIFAVIVTRFSICCGTVWVNNFIFFLILWDLFEWYLKAGYYILFFFVAKVKWCMYIYMYVVFSRTEGRKSSARVKYSPV